MVREAMLDLLGALEALWGVGGHYRCNHLIFFLCFVVAAVQSKRERMGQRQLFRQQ